MVLFVCSDHAVLHPYVADLLRANGCEVMAASQESAFEVRHDGRTEALVVCDHLEPNAADVLVDQFRRKSPQCRIIGLESDPGNTVCDADIIVDSEDPEALLAAVLG